MDRILLFICWGQLLVATLISNIDGSPLSIAINDINEDGPPLSILFKVAFKSEKVNGSSGLQGPPGEQGLPGAQGVAGADGIQGAAGADGAQGAAGADGAQGAAGADGAQGPAGAEGAQGEAGADGAQGAAGADGGQGPAGADGAQGPAGADGAQGSAGADGAQGPAGAEGAQGPAGPEGPQGPAGEILCPPQFRPRGNECFFIHDDVSEALNWDESKQKCLDIGGDLAQPQDMVDFVKYIENDYPNIKSPVWLGATDRETEQQWMWNSGKSVPSVIWKTGAHLAHSINPSGDGNCMDLFYRNGFFVNDENCASELFHFACEIGL